MKGISRSVLKSDGPDLLERIRRIEQLAEGDLTAYPPSSRGGPGRPPPEVEELLLRLKEVRNRRADELGISRGTLMSNSTLLEIARHAPRDRAGLSQVEGVKTWQVDATGEALMTELA